MTPDPKKAKPAEDFLDDWMELNIARGHLHPDTTVEGLRKRCLRDAKLAGIPTSLIEDVVVDLELAIKDEFVARKRAALAQS
jgi:hypothetical protein